MPVMLQGFAAVSTSAVTNFGRLLITLVAAVGTVLKNRSYTLLDTPKICDVWYRT